MEKYFNANLFSETTDANDWIRRDLYDFDRKGKWCAALELGKEKQVFFDLKLWEYKMFWIILGSIW